MQSVWHVKLMCIRCGVRRTLFVQDSEENAVLGPCLVTDDAIELSQARLCAPAPIRYAFCLFDKVRSRSSGSRRRTPRDHYCTNKGDGSYGFTKMCVLVRFGEGNDIFFYKCAGDFSRQYPNVCCDVGNAGKHLARIAIRLSGLSRLECG